MIHEKTITFDGITMNYQDAGMGLPVLFGHSYLWDANMWLHQVPELSQTYRCIVPHMFGHGRNATKLPPTCHSLSDLANIYQKFMQVIGIDSYAVVGLSLGGMWAAHLAAKFPHCVRGTVLMDTYLGAEPADKKAEYFSLIEKVRVQGFTEEMGHKLAPFFFKPNCEQFYLDLFAKQFTMHSDLDSVAALGHIIFDRPNDLGLFNTLHDLQMPTIIVVGEKDIARPSHEAAEMAKLLGSAHIEIPESGHIPVIEQPLISNMVLVQCLARIFETKLAAHQIA